MHLAHIAAAPSSSPVMGDRVHHAGAMLRTVVALLQVARANWLTVCLETESGTDYRVIPHSEGHLVDVYRGDTLLAEDVRISFEGGRITVNRPGTWEMVVQSTPIYRATVSARAAY